jgi:hypothetical protein
MSRLRDSDGFFFLINVEVELLKEILVQLNL